MKYRNAYFVQASVAWLEKICEKETLKFAKFGKFGKDNGGLCIHACHPIYQIVKDEGI